MSKDKAEPLVLPMDELSVSKDISFKWENNSQIFPRVLFGISTETSNEAWREMK